MTGAKASIMIVDDHPVIAASMAMALRTHGFEPVVAVAPEDLQANAASVRFQYVATATTVTEVSWVCTNTNNENFRDRQRTTTTTTETSGVVTTVARERNQITGFNLAGYASLTQSSSSETDGPQLNSCPSGPWVLSEPAGAPVVDEDASTSEGGLQVSIDGTNWSDI